MIRFRILKVTVKDKTMMPRRNDLRLDGVINFGPWVDGLQLTIVDNGNWISVVLDYVLRILSSCVFCLRNSVSVIIAGILGFVARHVANLSFTSPNNQTNHISEGSFLDV